MSNNTAKTSAIPFTGSIRMNSGLQAWNEDTQAQMQVMFMEWDLWAYVQGAKQRHNEIDRNVKLIRGLSK